MEKRQDEIGTAVGILLGGLILSIHVFSWKLVIIVMVLQFIIKLLVVRNYIIAVAFVTPMALIITHFAGVEMPIISLIEARFIDTLLGSFVALLAGMFLWHNASSSRFPVVMKAAIKSSTVLQSNQVSAGYPYVEIPVQNALHYKERYK